MPKKAPKNAYFYFMIDFREEQRQKGINFPNMTEVQKAADPVWRAAAPAVRSKYERRVKEEKARMHIQDGKLTSTGLPFTEIDNRERLTKEAAERELRDIQNFVQQNSFNKKILDQDIFIIDVNALCETNNGYVIGEVSILRFNISDGIQDHIHQTINPANIPLGYASDIKIGCQELGLNFPDSDAPRCDMLKLLSLIIDYLKKGDDSVKVLPPLYTMPEKEDQVLDFTAQLCHRAHEDESIFRVYKLDILFFYVINSLKNHNNEGLPKESLALALLRKDAFKYSPGLGCEHHEANDKSTECTKARVKRWAYTVLDSCCPVAGVEAVPGQHVPEGVDIDAVLAFKEKKREERCLPECRAPSALSSRDTSYDHSFEGPSTSQHAWETKKPKKPLRKPTIDTLNFHSRILAPELSENAFPPLNLGSGRGAGRRLNSGMTNLKLNE